jgi:putative membrane protein
MIENLATNVLAAAIFAFLGIAILGIALVIFDKLTPGTLWKELMEDQNVAIGIVIAGLTIGISIIIAAAVH